MFWRIGFHTVSPINNILEREDFTLEELFAEDDMIQECKGGNLKLVEYLSKPEILTKVIEYATISAPEDVEDKELYAKHAYQSSEVICCDVNSITQALFDNPELLRQLFDFLEQPTPLPSLEAGYFCKMVGMLLQTQIHETLEYMQSRPTIVPQIVQHIGTDSILELLVRIVSADEVGAGDVGPVSWLFTENLVPQLAKALGPDSSEDAQANAASALCEIITKSASRASNTNRLVEQLWDTEVLKGLVQNILNDDGSAFMHGLSVLIEILDHYSTQMQEDEKFSVDEEDEVDDDNKFEEFLGCILGQLGEFVTLLNKPPSTSVIVNTAGELSPPLGLCRLKILEFFASLLRTGASDIFQAMINLDVLMIPLDLFFQYQWNNLLHNVVEKIIFSVLEGDCVELRMIVLKQYNLVDRILSTTEANEASAVRLGHMGHLTRISNAIVKAATLNPPVQEYLDTVEKWSDYVSSKLCTTNEVESRNLGGTPARPIPQDSMLGGFEQSSDTFNDDDMEQSNPFDEDDQCEYLDKELDCRGAFHDLADEKSSEFQLHDEDLDDAFMEREIVDESDNSWPNDQISWKAEPASDGADLMETETSPAAAGETVTMNPLMAKKMAAQSAAASPGSPKSPGAGGGETVTMNPLMAKKMAAQSASTPTAPTGGVDEAAVVESPSKETQPSEASENP